MENPASFSPPTLLRAVVSVAFGLSGGLIFWLLLARVAHSAPPSQAWMRTAVVAVLVFLLASIGSWWFGKIGRVVSIRQKHGLTKWLILVQAALMGALALTALIPAGAPMMGRISVGLLALAIGLKLVWQFKTAGAPPKGLTANSASVFKIAVFALTFALPFAVLNIDTRLAFIAAGLCMIGCVVDRWMLLKD